MATSKRNGSKRSEENPAASKPALPANPALSTRPGAARPSIRPSSLMSSSSATATMTRKAPSREQIAERAKAIWQQKGCPCGQDEQNWLEAERQLRQE